VLTGDVLQEDLSRVEVVEASYPTIMQQLNMFEHI
jgi:hypothetical protein